MANSHNPATPPISLSHIQAPIAEELAYFEKYFRSAMKSDVGMLDKVTRYLLRTKGKQMRPMLVMFSAGVCGGIAPPTYRAAALVELLHTATLIHDDVVDDADERRSFFSINALWKNKVAVLVGDFLLSKGLLMALEHDDFQSLKIVSEAVKLMSEGELLQQEKSRLLNIDEAVYIDVIRQKTASLMAACCAAGANSAGANSDEIERMRLFGEKMGIAFQIKDDLMDYGSDDIGKPKAIDIKERKMTLPLIHVLNKSSWRERRKLVNTVKRHNKDPKKVAWLIAHVKENGGISYSQEVMENYVTEASNILDTFPDSEARSSMAALMHYAILRKK